MSNQAETRSDNQLLLGIGRKIDTVSDEDFQKAMKALPEHMASRLAFMSPEHHAIRDFVVREMPRQSQPISPLRIAQTTGLNVGKVNAILGDLEEHLFFLVRNALGAVTWAFPVTTARTPHRLTFSTGEHTSGA